MPNARRTSIRNTRSQSSDNDDEDTIEFHSGSNNDLTKHKRATKPEEKKDGEEEKKMTKKKHKSSGITNHA